MRQIFIVTATVWVAVIAALFGTATMNAHLSQKAEAATAPSSIDIMQMTRDAKVLPVEQFDAI